MLIEGTHTLQAPPDEVWQVLTQQESLRHTIPGATQISPLQTNGADSYEAILEIPQGPFKGQHPSLLTFSQQQAPFQYQLTIEDPSRDAFKAVYTVQLQPHDQETVVLYKGVLTGDAITSRAPTIIKGAIKYLTQEYFLTVTTLLHEQTRALAIDNRTNGKIDGRVLSKARGHIAIFPQHNGSNLIVNVTQFGHQLQERTLHFDWKDEQQQAILKKRVRQIGIVVSLLALVWIGTKIPRRS